MTNFNGLRSLVYDLRRSILIFVAMMLFAAGFISGAVSQFRSLLIAHEVEESNIYASNTKVNQLRGELDSAKKFVEAFEALKEAGVLSPFAKQAALDQVDQVMQLGWVTPKTYSLAAQSSLEGQPFAKLTSHLPLKNSLSFEVSLPHELRLLHLIDALTEKSTTGLTTVESCEMERKSTGQKSGEVSNSALSARCTLHWYYIPSKIESLLAKPLSAGSRP
jgi:hypothetical protein